MSKESNEVPDNIIVRLERIIKITTEARDKFLTDSDTETAYTSVYASMCTASAHMDAICTSAHAHVHGKEEKAKKKEEKKGKKRKKHDKRKKD